MKTHTSIQCTVSRITLLLVAIFTTSSAMFAQNDEPRRQRPGQAEGDRGAQRRPRGDQPGGPGGQFGGGMRGGGYGGGGLMFNDPSLTEEQRAAVSEATEAVSGEMREVMERMGKARRALQEAIYAEKMDQDVIRKHAAEVGKSEGEMAIVRATIFAKIRSKLTAEQIERMKNPPPFGSGGGGQFRGPRPDGDRPQGARPDGEQPRRPRPDGVPSAPTQPRRPALDDK